MNSIRNLLALTLFLACLSPLQAQVYLGTGGSMIKDTTTIYDPNTFEELLQVEDVKLPSLILDLTDADLKRSNNPLFYNAVTDTTTTYDPVTYVETNVVEENYRHNYAVQFGDVYVPAEMDKGIQLSKFKLDKLLMANNINLICVSEHLAHKVGPTKILGITSEDKVYDLYDIEDLDFDISRLFIQFPISIVGASEEHEISLHFIVE